MSRIAKQLIRMIPWRLRPMIKRVPLVATAQRWYFGRMLDGTQFNHTIDAGPAKGLRYPIKMPEDKAIWTGQYEVQFSTWVAEHARVANVCYDIGAYHGYFSGLMTVSGAKRVISFEPVEENRRLIHQMMELNPGLEVTVLAVAISDRDGETEFLMMADGSMGKLATSDFQRDQPAAMTRQVDIRSIDSLVQHETIPSPDLIKIDVEGAEFEVLNGARRVLTSSTPTLCIEIHTRQIEHACCSLLTNLGYDVRLRSQHHDYSCGANHLLAMNTNMTPALSPSS